MSGTTSTMPAARRSASAGESSSRPVSSTGSARETNRLASGSVGGIGITVLDACTAPS